LAHKVSDERESSEVRDGHQENRDVGLQT
jgi:hypothetical protein